MNTLVPRRLQMEIIYMVYTEGAIYLYSVHAECVGALQLHNLNARIINYQTMIYGSDVNCELPNARPTYPPERDSAATLSQWVNAFTRLALTPHHTTRLINDIIYLQRCNKIIRLGLPAT
jgi:hypothetical protein